MVAKGTFTYQRRCGSFAGNHGRRSSSKIDTGCGRAPLFDEVVVRVGHTRTVVHLDTDEERGMYGKSIKECISDKVIDAYSIIT